MGATNNQPIVSEASVWNEDTYHNTLPEVFVTPKNNQIGKKTLLKRVSDAANNFLGGIHLPTVNVNHEIGAVGGTDKKYIMYGIIGVVALMIFRRR